MSLVSRYLLMLLLFVCCAWARAEPLALDHEREELAGYMSVFIDKSGKMDFEDVAAPYNSERFRPLKGELNEGITDAAIWLKFTVQRSSQYPAEWWLEVQPALIEQLNLYVPNADGSYTMRQAGTHLPFAKREVEYRNPVFKLQLPTSVPQTYYLRIKTVARSSMHLTFWQPEAFLSKLGSEQLVLGLFLGVYAMLALASFWFERASRDGVYKFLGLYALGCLWMVLAESGLMFQYLFPGHPQWAQPTWTLSFLVGGPMAIEFLFRFVDMPERYPRLTRYYLWAIRIYVLGLISMIGLGFHAEAAAQRWIVGATVIAPLTFAILFVPILKSRNEIRYALFASSAALFAEVAIRALLEIGHVERNILTENVGFLGSMTFCLISYYATSRRYYTIRQAKERAQSDLLEMAQRTEQELEQQVRARTDDLLEAMKTVETALSRERAAHEEQRQFISTVSHELRTPLAVIDATTQNLTRDALQENGPARMLGRLEKIQQATERLSSLFDNYLSSNRLDIMSQGVHPRQTPLLPLLEDAIRSARPLANRHLFLLKKKHLPETIHADPDLMRLVLRTLADNAVKYTPAGSLITLEAKTTEDGWEIEVRDNGPGIAPQERGMIFDRYFRGRASSGHTGTGLGLPLARRLIRMHGGSLTLVDTNGAGAVFRIWLPRNPAMAAEPAGSGNGLVEAGS
ncbi:hypothetical protein D3870_08210 [Noviherbaspirillum cavernae]|uniref:histidine kinase n=1 Tax=Noviherbaspirillum cavernae TaxID=2320862 RepID=A0A418X0P9_9BURK|nr:sensor histidine kinase [Noviherbaspirillum cavernae]RJG06002.1 hypothetical protein D3870_08210 [Noviherbaspirillum cavernae]